MCMSIQHACMQPGLRPLVGEAVCDHRIPLVAGLTPELTTELRKVLKDAYQHLASGSPC